MKGNWHTIIDEKGQILKAGLAKTQTGFINRLKNLFLGAKTIDDDLIEQIEEALIGADIGAQTSFKLLDQIQDQLEHQRYHHQPPLGFLLYICT